MEQDSREVINQVARWKEEVRKYNELLKTQIYAECDWDDPEDYNEYRRQKRAELRAELIPVSRVCPCCNEFVFKNRAWVVSSSLAVCRSCWTKFYEKKDGQWIRREAKRALVLSPLFYPVYRYILNGPLIKSQIINFSSFAKKVGWSRHYQYRILNGSQWVNRDTVICLMEALKKDQLIQQNLTRWEFAPSDLRRYRAMGDVSIRLMAKKCGWSGSYQQKIERGDQHTIGQEAKDKLTAILREFGIILVN